MQVGAAASSHSSATFIAIPPDEYVKFRPNSWDLRMSGMLSSILFPSQKKEVLAKARDRLIEEFAAERITLEDPDQCALDGIYIPARDPQSPLAKKAVIFAPGADGYYEDKWSYQFIRFIKERVGDVQILIVNYQGVHGSEGLVHPNKMSLSVFTAYSFLTDSRHLECEDIVIFSQSMGGMATIRALELLEHKFPDRDLNVVSERSFDSFIPVIRQFAGCLGFFAVNLMPDSWDEHSLAASLFRTKGERLIIYSKSDPIASYENSIERQAELMGAGDRIAHIELLDEEGDENAHYRPFKENEQALIAREMRRILRIDPPLLSVERVEALPQEVSINSAP